MDLEKANIEKEKSPEPEPKMAPPPNIKIESAPPAIKPSGRKPPLKSTPQIKIFDEDDEETSPLEMAPPILKTYSSVKKTKQPIKIYHDSDGTDRTPVAPRALKTYSAAKKSAKKPVSKVKVFCDDSDEEVGSATPQ